MTLPIEVVGPNGTVESAQFDVSNASGINRLWLQAHNLSYEGKASVRLNGGAWISLDNRTVSCAYPESEYDCVGGAYKTIRATVSISGVRSGRNTIEFRHNYAAGDISSGYRILKFNLLRTNGSEVLAASTFGYDDPNQWRAPRQSGNDIAAGKALWYKENSLKDVPGGPSITASCSNCHAQGGEDLKYFNYSNESIIARSEFHGLSRREAEQIASYIRSLDHPNPGTPWDPPYQPGPGLDSRPAAEWAAGAGLDAVLDRDEDMLPHLFPGRVAAEAVAVDATMNVREMPVAIQFPDWNEWLPRVHPKDAWGSVFLNHDVYRDYAVRYPNVMSGGVDRAVRSGDIVDFIEGWANEFRQFKKDTNKEYFFGGYGNDARVPDYMLGLFQWQAVKTWEIMTTNAGLEEAAPQIYPGVGEPRSWFGKARAVFDTAPHINGPDQSSPFPHGSEIQNRYFSTAWYQVQMTLNAGNRNGLNIRPQDWKYHLEHIRGNGKYTDIREPLRLFQSYAKMMQMADNARGVGNPSGWHMRHVTPAWLLAQRPGNSKDVFQDMDPNLRREITEALLTAFMDKMERHDLSEWSRETGLEGIEPASYRPQPYSGSGLVFDETTYADHFYRMIPLFNDMGVDPWVLKRIADWSKAAWPLGDWDSLYDAPTGEPPTGGPGDPGDGPGDPGDGPGDPGDGPGNGPLDPSTGLQITQPAQNAVFAPSAGVPVVVDFPGSASFAKVKFFVDGVKVHVLKSQSTPVRHTLSGLSDGAHELVVVAVDAAGKTYTTPPVQFTVEAGEVSTVIDEIALQRGWNTVTLSVRPLDTRIEAVVASIESQLKKVEDDAGRLYEPAKGTKQFDTWDPMRTYQVKVGKAITLRVEGTTIGDRTATVSTEQDGRRLDVELSQNAPNPVRGVAAIDYAIPDDGPVRLTVFNLLGQEMVTLVDGPQSAGRHTALLDASELPSGVYVYRLDVGGAQETRRMVVVN